ncbi:hypothetical protein A2881_05850 [Candidatus Peribacteria bacterium RIFCSPHIGHO2_01_FULL_55_13]|nr:MAG: hypothetical protein A2881_05850 [Candidatus Peribacteria bacterium RIFCSPHIGHO2_01_FULL_55_13]OGJ65945.1 MAG: hypothetical protein A3F36_04375 [Candidatus Peribacteria bacterium RIFCSPHIGHO2_12_FULL_55_11]
MPSDDHFLRFVGEARLQINRMCPHTLMQTSLVSFGGDTSGGGFITDAQGEDVDFVAECNHGLVASVVPFSGDQYGRYLHDVIMQPCPNAIVAEEFASGHKTDLFVEPQALDTVTQRVWQRPHLSRNVGGIYLFDDRRLREAKERLRARQNLWHVLSRGWESKEKSSPDLAPSPAAA